MYISMSVCVCVFVASGKAHKHILFQVIIISKQRQNKKARKRDGKNRKRLYFNRYMKTHCHPFCHLVLACFIFACFVFVSYLKHNTKRATFSIDLCVAYCKIPCNHSR